MVKKYMAILTMIVVCQTAFGQKNMDQLFKEFAGTKGVNSVNIGKITLSFASLFTETMGVDGIEVLSFDECAQDVKDKLASSLKSLKDSAYETMISSNEDNSKTRVLVKMKDDMIRELVVVTTGSSNALVRIKGKIKPEDIQKIVDQHSKN